MRVDQMPDGAVFRSRYDGDWVKVGKHPQHTEGVYVCKRLVDGKEDCFAGCAEGEILEKGTT